MVRYLTEGMTCPTCQEVIDLEEQPLEGHCPSCDRDLPLRYHLCPRCGYYNEEADYDTCDACGLSLTRRCPECTQRNWVGAEQCTVCGEALDVITDILAMPAKTSDRLYSQMEEAQRIKAAEAAASAERMARLKAVDEARLEELRRRQAEQKEEERRILVTAAIIAGILILALLIFTLISLL
jgi:hypothetical protein